MRSPLIILFLLLALGLTLNVYILKQLEKRSPRPKLASAIAKTVAVVFFVLILAGIVIPTREGGNAMLLAKMWAIYAAATIFISQLVGVTFDLIAAIPLIFNRKRLSIFTYIGIAASAICFLAMWWGALINRFNIATKDVDINITSLPASFDGYRVAQISDIHLGTYNGNADFVERLVEEVNAQHPDLIVFTGDIVNRQSDEMIPYIPYLRRLNAPDGAVAILGNHDYGDYKDWTSEMAKADNMSALFGAYAQTGITLLLNETYWLRRGNDSIALIGVENIGDPPFKVYGSLSGSYPNLSDSTTKILLSHNPAHWCDSIADHPDVNIPLTLSGHTHAMQIELAGLSPAAWRYKTWGGLYTDADSLHMLYVNIGAGTVGLPMRIGATPEITVITLHSKRK